MPTDSKFLEHDNLPFPQKSLFLIVFKLVNTKMYE